MKKKNKCVFSPQHTKRFLFIIAFCVISGLVYFTLRAIPQKVAYSEDKNNLAAELVSQDAGSDVQLASAESSKAYYLNLSNDIGVYVLSKKNAPCVDYRNTIRSRTFGFRCRTLNALWRGFWVKKIDVSGYNRLRLDASLGVDNHSGIFPECNNIGVSRENAADLIAFYSDPSVGWNRECNHEVGEDKWWDHCIVTNKSPSAIAHCGVPQCSLSSRCSMDINVAGRQELYLLFSVFDDWFADIEGTLSNVKIILTK